MVSGTNSSRNSNLKLREHIQNGKWRMPLTVGSFVLSVFAFWIWCPKDAEIHEKWLSGLQKTAFVAAAFGVTAYNLRTRVVDLALKVEGKPIRVDEFCRIARNCGRRLTNLVLLFTVTSALLGSLNLFTKGTTLAKWMTAISLGFLAASIVSFVYIVFSFERLERFALDEAELTARSKEAKRLFKDDNGTK